MSRLRKNTAIGCFLFIFSLSLSYAQERKMETDVVVVGFGVSAAVSAAEAGLKVIALEKQAIDGGSSNFAEGLFGVNTDQTRKNSVAITAEEAYRTAMEFNQSYRVNPALVKRYLEESAATIRWLEKQGVRTGMGVIIPVMKKLTNVKKEIDNAISAGSAKVMKASSLDDLAKNIAVDPKRLKASVTRYNQIMIWSR
ncbi:MULTISPECIES: FAD-binding protein [Brenneria]|uniref:FAD-binding protein n=1 Tax=Brenneria nigrifluens DSM 30175 = ATCC 13028 TaxID=1121120 RepID=A0A2U1URP6_9GAMM|nr:MULTISPECIES: FAD-binding protein [Brenneria]EHD23043.1 fumarate reductase/succinate dehydrogenase flavoprotein domain protein [Brenneria sp. EniD312]PWC24340.1 FAD-binding protein [Brenneria nigrifluens] [Brenneria nigrifluens DSM 30175 = ATCC 13028]QCR05938.1 FAD-binding protein [Brenneria nigrifluens] [Brenneria nigrifluens DSM 30175 = ATCC 13028]